MIDQKTKAENSLYRFECAIDTLDKLSDALIDDPKTANAINGLHQTLCAVYNDVEQIFEAL